MEEARKLLEAAKSLSQKAKLKVAGDANDVHPTVPRKACPKAKGSGW